MCVVEHMCMCIAAHNTPHVYSMVLSQLIALAILQALLVIHSIPSKSGGFSERS